MPIRALVWKELRSSALIVAIAGFVFGAWLMWLTNGFGLWPQPPMYSYQQSECELAIVDGAFWYAVLAGSLSLFLGINAARTESIGKHWQFALFRPVSRRMVMATKIAVGVLLSSVISVVPLFVYFVWLRQPGNLQGPFDSSFYRPTCSVWIWTPLMFLAAFWSELNEARWWGSKFWPVLGVIVACFWLWFMPLVEPREFAFMLDVLPVGWFVLGGLLLAAVMGVGAERDFA